MERDRAGKEGTNAMTVHTSAPQVRVPSRVVLLRPALEHHRWDLRPEVGEALVEGARLLVVEIAGRGLTGDRVLSSEAQTMSTEKDNGREKTKSARLLNSGTPSTNEPSIF